MTDQKYKSNLPNCMSKDCRSVLLISGVVSRSRKQRKREIFQCLLYPFAFYLRQAFQPWTQTRGSFSPSPEISASYQIRHNKCRKRLFSWSFVFNYQHYFMLAPLANKLFALILLQSFDFRSVSLIPLTSSFFIYLRSKSIFGPL